MNGSTIIIKEELEARLESLRHTAMEMSPRLEQTQANRDFVAGYLAALDAIAKMHSIRVQRVIDVSEPWKVVAEPAGLFEMIGREP